MPDRLVYVIAFQKARIFWLKRPVNRPAVLATPAPNRDSLLVLRATLAPNRDSLLV